MNIEHILYQVAVGVTALICAKAFLFIVQKAVAFVESRSEILDQEVSQTPTKDPRFSWPEFRIYEQPSRKAPSYFSYEEQYYHVKPPTKQEIDEEIKRAISGLSNYGGR
jgi:hypothetical protein